MSNSYDAYEPAVDYMLTGRRIKKLRLDIGMSQQELAEKADLSPQYICHVENGRKKASLESMVRISRVLGVKLDSVVKEVETKDAQKDVRKEMIDYLMDCSPYELDIMTGFFNSTRKAMRRD